MFVLYSQNYAARALPILFNTPKKSLLKSSYPKKYLPNFHTPKNPGIENFKPKKIFRLSPSLEIPSTPPPPTPGLSPCKVAIVERELQLYFIAAFLNFRLNFWRYSPSSVWCMKFKLLIHQIIQKVRVPLKVWFMINLACGCEHLQANSKGRNLCAIQCISSFTIKPKFSGHP